jgi:Uma2 family endonuclease
MTIDEYLFETDETTYRRELAYGILREPPAPFFGHQVVTLQVARIWIDHVEPRGLGRVAVAPVDVILDRDRHLIVQPDVLFIAAARLSIVDNQVWGAPDLVADVLSPGTRTYDDGEKLEWYRQYGVREYWRVDLKTETVTIADLTAVKPIEHRLKRNDRLRSSVLTGLDASVFQVFA